MSYCGLSRNLLCTTDPPDMVAFVVFLGFDGSAVKRCLEIIEMFLEMPSTRFEFRGVHKLSARDRRRDQPAERTCRPRKHVMRIATVGR